jgi:hypothetical protein
MAGTAGCEVHTNFAHESACPMADKCSKCSSYNSQITAGVENAVTINGFFKSHRHNNPSCTYSTPDINFHWIEWDFVG